MIVIYSESHMKHINTMLSRYLTWGTEINHKEHIRIRGLRVAVWSLDYRNTRPRSLNPLRNKYYWETSEKAISNVIQKLNKWLLGYVTRIGLAWANPVEWIYIPWGKRPTAACFNCYGTVTLHKRLTTHICTAICFYPSTTLQSCCALAAFSVSWSFTHSVGLLGRGISPSQRRLPAHRTT
jgi:hypothetical protein